MRAPLRLVGAVAVCALLSGACDWPMFRSGPAGTGFNDDGVITTANVSTLTPLWSVPVTVPTSRRNQLAEGQGTVMLGNQAYDASSGRSRWTSGLLDGGPATIGDNLVYGTGPGSGPDSYDLRALDITNGVQRWSQVIDFPTQPPVAAASTVYVAESAPHGGGQGIATFDAKTGTPGWGLSFLTMGAFTVANGVLYVQGERIVSGGSQIGLFAFDANNGVQRWVVPTSPCGQSNTLPVVANGRVYSDGQTFDAGNGAFLWNWPVCPTGTAANDFPSRTADISVSSDTVFVPYLNVKFGMLLGAFDAQTGRTRWTIGWSTVGPMGSAVPEPAAPAVTDDVVFGVARNGFGGTDIIGDSAKTGARLWDSPASPYNDFIDPIVANGVVYAASTDGHLDAFHLPGR